MTRRWVRWRRTARNDLLHLARWVAQDNPDAAHRFLDAAREAAHMLAELPKLGPAGRFRSRGLWFDRVDTGLATIRGEIKALEGQIAIVKWITNATFAGTLAQRVRLFQPPTLRIFNVDT